MSKHLPFPAPVMSLQDFMVLESVARRLALKYPPDWLERHGQSVYCATLMLSFVAAMLAGLAWGPWWGFLLPMLVPGLVLVVLPRCLFGREAGKPRWAHPRAALDRQDLALLEQVLHLEQDQALSGAGFFEIWRRTRRRIEYRHG